MAYSEFIYKIQCVPKNAGFGVLRTPFCHSLTMGNRSINICIYLYKYMRNACILHEI